MLASFLLHQSNILFLLDGYIAVYKPSECIAMWCCGTQVVPHHIKKYILSWINIYFLVVNIYEILLTHVGGMLKLSCNCTIVGVHSTKNVMFRMRLSSDLFLFI